MPCRGPRIKSMLIVLAACWTAMGGVHAQGPDLDRDPARFVATLRERGLVTQVLRPQIEAVVTVLAAQARQWPRSHVNGPYDPGALNVYLIDTAAGANLPDNVGRLRATLMILVDADYLAQVKAAADLSWASTSRAERLVSHFDALAATQVEGPDAAMRSRLGSGADWRRGTNELFDGAAAFLIAHEMAHVLAGLDSALEGPVRRPPGLQGRDADRFWACSNLVGEKITGTRQQEADADQYAAGNHTASLAAQEAAVRARSAVSSQRRAGQGGPDHHVAQPECPGVGGTRGTQVERHAGARDGADARPW